MHGAKGLLLLLLLARPISAAQLWAAWDLDLGDHAPPTHFVLTVTSPTGTPVPPPMTVPWASCTALPHAQHCAPVGVGTNRLAPRTLVRVRAFQINNQWWHELRLI